MQTPLPNSDLILYTDGFSYCPSDNIQLTDYTVVNDISGVLFSNGFYCNGCAPFVLLCPVDTMGHDEPVLISLREACTAFKFYVPLPASCQMIENAEWVQSVCWS